MNVNERFRRSVEIVLDHAREKAMTGQVLYVKDGETRNLEFIDINDLPYGESTVGQTIDLLNSKIAALESALNGLVDVVNSNQEATTAAIDDLRKKTEEGLIL